MQQHGVGFLVHSKLTACILEFKAISEKLSILNRKGRKFNTLIAQCYTLPNDHQEYDHVSFYEKLKQAIKACTKRDTLIVMGDFNVQLEISISLTVMPPESITTPKLGLTSEM